MIINQNEIERYFSVNDEVPTGAGRRIFKITEILDNKIRIQPKAAKNKDKHYPLGYNKLSIVINNFDKIVDKNIEHTVRVVLKENGLNGDPNETYLYGLAISQFHQLHTWV
jgi:hypothetical protein